MGPIELPNFIIKDNFFLHLKTFICREIKNRMKKKKQIG